MQATRSVGRLACFLDLHSALPGARPFKSFTRRTYPDLPSDPNKDGSDQIRWKLFISVHLDHRGLIWVRDREGGQECRRARPAEPALKTGAMSGSMEVEKLAKTER